MDTFEVIAARRNVRAYTGQPIPGADLDRILDAARRAPSASNRQPWDLIVCTDRAQLQRLATVWRGGGHIATSAATVAIIGPANADFPGQASMQFDFGQLAMILMLAATELGIGTGHSAVGDQALAKEILKFPDDRFCAWLIALGYPADTPIKPLRRHNRRPFEEVVHRGAW